MNKIFPSISLLTLFIFSAFANEPFTAQPTPPAPQKSGFSGFYVGGVAGYNFAKIPRVRGKFSVRGIAVGLSAGYMAPLGKSGVILGFDLTGLLNNDEGRWFEAQSVNPRTETRTNGVFKSHYIGEAMARAGYDIFKNFLPFVKFGISYTKISFSRTTETIRTTILAGAPFMVRTDATTTLVPRKGRVGAAFGAGVLFPVTPHLLAGVEYTLTGFPAKRSLLNVGKWSQNRVSLNLAYKF